MSQCAHLLVGAKGGVGATTLCFELAERMRTAGSRVLVDADLSGQRSHAVWFDVAAELDAERAYAQPAVGTSKGKQIIELSRSYEEGFAVAEDAVDALREACAPDATFIVDAPQPFAAAVRPFTVRATRIVVIAEPTLLGIAAARSMLNSMRRAGIPEDRILIVTNEPRGQRDLSAAEIQQTLKHAVAIELPSNRDRRWNKAVDALARELSSASNSELLVLASANRGPVGDRRAAVRNGEIANGVAPLPPIATVTRLAAARENLKAELHEAIFRRIDFQVAARAHTDTQKLAELRGQVDEIATTLLGERTEQTTADESARIRREIVDEAVGLGPIESLLNDPDITEIMVNGFRNVYVERKGRIEQTAKRFTDDRQVRLVIERIIAPLGRRIDEASPMVDARLPDGSRVNAIIEPLAIDGPTLTIRRFGKRRLGMDDLIELGSLNRPFSEFLRAAVEARLNIVVSGGTGSGKTTLLNALSSFIPEAERIVTIEDAAELRLDQPHVVRLESRPENIEGTGEVTIRELVRNSLRMRPDRVVIGECRGGEALDMLQAMNTGHDGSLTTVHANSPRDAIARIETLVLMAGFDLPVRAIREQISSALDVVIQTERLRDGSRRVTSISEVIGMEGDIVTMQEIAHFRQQGVDAKGVVQGVFDATGVQPYCLTRFDEMGVRFDVASLRSTPNVETLWALR